MLPLTPEWDARVQSSGLKPLADPLAVSRLYRVPDVLPRAYFSRQVVHLDDDAALDRIFQDDVLSGSTIVLPPDSPNAVAAADNQVSAPADCKLTSFSNTKVEAKCQSTSSGYAVFVEQFHPGWHATVDGHPSRVLRANLVMRAVALPPGEHRVSLSFSVPELEWALWVSALGFLMIGAMLLRGRANRPAE